jgi:hypothetical protein
MIHSDPPIKRMTIRVPKASANTLLVLSGPVVTCRNHPQGNQRAVLQRERPVSLVFQRSSYLCKI